MKNVEYLILLFFIYTNLFFGVTSKSIPINIFQEIRNGTGPAACKTVEFLLKSNYTKSCALETFPLTTAILENSRNQTILCLALYDYSSKWCSKSSQNFQLPEIGSEASFDSEVAKFASVENIEMFCESEKNSVNETLAIQLENLYKHSSKCSLYCMSPSKGTYMPKEICSVLSWMDYILKTHNEVPRYFQTFQSTDKVDGKTDKTEEQNTKAKNPEVKTAVVENTVKDKMSNKTKEPKSEKISSIISNDKSNPVVSKVTDKLPASQANAEANSHKAKNSVAKNVNQENVSKLDPSSVSELPKTEPKAPKKGKILTGVENTEVKPPSQDEISTINKKPESSDEKVQKPAEVKSSTLSENTDEFNDNLGIGGEDPDFQVPPADNEDDPADDTGLLNQNQEVPAPKEVQHYHNRATEDDSHFFSYFVVFSLMFVCFYIAYHNKKKILAMFLEGRRSHNRRGRRRPSTVNYRKLDCNLEEAVTSQCNSNVTHVIY